MYKLIHSTGCAFLRLFLYLVFTCTVCSYFYFNHYRHSFQSQTQVRCASSCCAVYVLPAYLSSCATYTCCTIAVPVYEVRYCKRKPVRLPYIRVCGIMIMLISIRGRILFFEVKFVRLLVSLFPSHLK